MGAAPVDAGGPSAGAGRGGPGGLLFRHEIDHYPTTMRRSLYLAVAVAATIVLYYVYYAPTGVATLLLRDYHMSFKFYVYIIVVANLLGAFASLPASRTDKIGRSNVVIYGLLVVGLLQTFAVPAAGSKWWLGAILGLIGIAEGAILVATPALVRDFSPQFGRATAMGFWTIGPVAGSLIVSLIVSKTLGNSANWQGQIRASGIVALAMFVVALFFMKDLSSRLRDQIMYSERDRAILEARARGISDEELLAASQNGWRQILKPDLIGSAFGISVFLLFYYAAAGFFVVFWAATFVNKDGTPFSTGQANALNVWVWTFDIAGLLVVGYLSDKLRVRKPFMVLGALIAIVSGILFLTYATDPHTGYYKLAVTAAAVALGLGIAYTPWMASYTESIEAKNPALVATGLSLWGWILRIVVGISTLILPLVITSTTTVVDNADRLPTILQYQKQYANELKIVQPNQELFTKLATYSNPTAQAPQLVTQAIAAVKAAGPQYATPTAQLQELLRIQKAKPALTYLSTYGPPLQKASADSGRQWQHWLWVDVGGMVLFLPFVFSLKGRWSPKKAREDAAEHERALLEAAEENPDLAERAAANPLPAGDPA